MRSSLIALALFNAFSLSALAAKPMTVEQLQASMAAAQAEHRTDDAQLKQLADIRLTARLTGFDLQQMAALSPGPATTQALYAIADASAFLDPPASEIPDKPAPTPSEQSAMFAQTLHYAVHVLPTLPNLLAIRSTQHYVDSLRGLEFVSAQRGELYWIGNHQAPVAFRDGRETDDPATTAASEGAEKKNHTAGTRESGAPDPVGGLSSWGEFGPILKVVLGDSIKGKLSWARWELENGKPVAVFHFAVDRSLSHYGISYCCEITAEATSAGLSKVKRPVLLRQVGYHGNLEVEPETGAILRVVIEAELRPEDSIQRSSMMVEYGPVKIGDSVSICPVHSVSITASRAEYESHGEMDSFTRMLLNDVRFTDYHRFGSESTLSTPSGL